MSGTAQAPRLLIAALTDQTDNAVARARRVAANHPAAREMLDSLDRLPPPQAVVVVGETKKGKSSIVNALLERPAASPVAVDVATATYVVFQYGRDGRAYVTGHPGAIPLEDLDKWVTVDGIATNADLAKITDRDGSVAAAGGTPRPLPVDVRLPVAMLRDVALIDTPGVGGLVGEHADMTMGALKKGGTLLFVTDINVPLTEGEAEFLTRAAAETSMTQLIIVANMSDRLAGDQLDRAHEALEERIAEHLPALAHAPVITLSARDAIDAVDPATPAAMRDLLLESSGINELRSHLDRITAQSPVLTQLQRLRVVHQVARTVEATENAVEVAVGSGPVDVAELEHVRTVTGQQADDGRMLFSNAVGQLRRTLSKRIDQALDKVMVELDELIADRLDGPVLDARMEARLTEIAADSAELFEQGVAAAARTHLVADADDTPELVGALLAELDQATLQAGAELDMHPNVDRRNVQGTLDDQNAHFFAGYTGYNMIHGLTGTGVGAAITGALTSVVGIAMGPVVWIGAGAAMVGWSRYRASRRFERTKHSNWARESIKIAKAEVQNELAQRADDVTMLVALAMRRYVRARTEVLNELIKMAKAQPAANPVIVSTETRDAARQLAELAETTIRKMPTALPAGPAVAVER